MLHLYYITAFILPPGKSVLECFGESPLNDVKVNVQFDSPFVFQPTPSLA